MDTSEALLRAATYLKWWRDGAIAEAQQPDDIVEIIVALEQLAAQLDRGVPDEWESVEFRASRPQIEPPEA